MAARGALVVIGIGPGIGRAVTTKFASEGFNRIFIMSRSAERLEEEKAAVLKDTSNKDVKIDSIIADVIDPKSLAAALKEVDDSGEVVEVVYYNAAKVAPSTLLEFPVESMDEDWKVGLHSSVIFFHCSCADVIGTGIKRCAVSGGSVVHTAPAREG
jgi:NAD(P)-dependent dehydrogenase (short-subunit alcohol dehydrogenase family)